MNNVADKLYNILGTKFDNTDIKTLDSSGKETTDMEEIEMFSFDFLVNSRNYGPVVILLSANENLEVYYGDNTSKSLESDAKKKWENLIEHLSTFARSNRLGFSLKHTTDLKYDLSNITDITESYRNIFEGYYGSRKTSYNKQGKAKIIIKHTRALGEDEKRFRNISALFIENADGERFKLPFKKLTGARAMARHVTEGGNPYDLFGTHISEMVNDINTLGGFVRRSKMYEGNDEAMGMVETGRNHYNSMRKGLKRIAGVRGYHTYKESWEPSAITEQETDTSAIRKLFTEKTVNQRTEDALPLLARLQRMAEAQDLNEKAPPGMEDWIKSNKAEFIDQYGEEKGLEVLYATAWKRHNANESISDDEIAANREWNARPEVSGIQDRGGYETMNWPEEVKSKEFPGDTHPDQPSDEYDDDDIPVSQQYGVGNDEYENEFDIDEDFSPELREGDFGFTENGDEQVAARNKAFLQDKERSSEKPSPEEMYRTIKDFNLTALQGYARRIGMTPDMIGSRADEDMMIDEIMGYLYDENWERTVMATGAFNEATGGDPYDQKRSDILVEFLSKNAHRGAFDTLTLTRVLAEKGYTTSAARLEELLSSMEQNGLVQGQGKTNRLGSGNFSYSTWTVENTARSEMKEINEFEKWADNIVEGVWALPQTPKAMRELQTWFETEQPLGIDAVNATEALHDILGSDDLFAELEETAKEYPDLDARPIVKDYVTSMYENLNAYPEDEQPMIVSMYKAVGGESIYPHEVGEGCNNDLDHDGSTSQLNASANKEFDKYIQKEGVDDWKKEVDDSGEKPTDNRGNEDYDDTDVDDLKEEKKEWKKPWEQDDDETEKSNASKKEEDKYKEELDNEAAGTTAKEVDESLNESADLTALMQRTNFLLHK